MGSPRLREIDLPGVAQVGRAVCYLTPGLSNPEEHALPELGLPKSMHTSLLSLRLGVWRRESSEGSGPEIRCFPKVMTAGDLLG